MGSRTQVLSSKTVYQGSVIQVKVDRIREPGGVAARREVVCHGGSVVVLPRLPRSKVLLVRQFRYPVGQSLWELVAGSIDRGETPAQAAQRELREETGYRAEVVRPVARFYSSPGFLSERMHLFEALRLTPGKAQLESDERIRSKAFSMMELSEMVKANTIQDAKTLIGLLWLLNRHQRNI